MNNKKFALLQAFKTNEIFQTGDPISHLFEQKQFESETQFEVSTKKIKNDMFDITLAVHLKTRDVESKDAAYNITVKYTGIFEISGLNEEEVEKAIRTHASLMLYPYCRSAINSVVSDSPFPNVTIPPIDFFAIYEEQKKQQKNEVVEKDSA